MNTIVITAIEKEGNNIRDYSYFCIESWQNWCNKNNVILQVITEDEFIHPKFAFLSIFEKFNADKIIHVDLDTLIHPKTPNLFELYNDTFTVVKDSGKIDYEISPRMTRGVDSFESIFDSFNIDKSKYFNSGMMMFNKNHSTFLKESKNWIESNYDKIAKWSSAGDTGLDQTPFNWLVQKHNIETKFLDMRYNRTGLVFKNLYVNDNYIIHFRGLKTNRRIKLMKEIHNYLVGL